MTLINAIKGDLTTMTVDAIVNAANSSLLGGGGVDGAIHRAAGKELLEACRPLNGCKTGEAKITGGYKLPAKYVIHTVGPIWNGGKNGEHKKLHNCYYNSLKLAMENGIKTLAFPSISTGVYRYPKADAATTAIEAVNEYCAAHPEAFTEITFVCFDDDNFNIYKTLLNQNS